MDIGFRSIVRNMVLKIISHNVNGNVEVIPFVIVQHRPDVIVIIEAHGRLRNVLGFSNVFISDDLSVLIRQDMHYRLVSHSIDPVSHDIAVFDLHGTTLVSAYLRSGRKSTGMLKLREMSQVQSPKRVIIGDLNANFVRENVASRILKDWIDNDGDLFILNDPAQYTFRRPHCSPSVLDYGIVSGSLVDKTHFQVIQDFHSDHRPIMIGLGDTVERLTGNYEDLYPVRSLNLHRHPIPEQFADKLEKLIEDQGDRTVGLHQLINRVLNMKGIRRQRRRRHHHRRRKEDELIPLPRYLVEMKKFVDSCPWDLTLPKKFKRAVRKWKRERWFNFCQEIDFEWTTERVWKKFNASRGKPARMFTQDFAKEVERIKNDFQEFSDNQMPPVLYSLVRFDLSDDMVNQWNQLFTLVELEIALSQLSSNSAPGPDGLHYGIYKALGVRAKKMLLNLLNQYFESGTLPESCKQALQIALSKPDGGYRPITLINCHVKILEKLVYNRIAPFLDRFLPDYQFGFRKKRSSADQAARFIARCQQLRESGYNVGVLFLDIKKAFDRVDRRLVYGDLYEVGVRGRILVMIKNLLEPSSVRVLLEGFVSNSYVPKDGTPQGGILSPVIWSFYFRGLPFAKSEPFGFADDVALLTYSKSDPFPILSKEYESIRNFASRRKIQFSDSKVKSMLMSTTRKRRRDSMNVPVVTYRDLAGNVRLVEQVSHYKYLGIVIDDKLNFVEWTNVLCKQIDKRTQMISRIGATVKLSRRAMETFYNGYVRGYIQYGSSIMQAVLSPRLKEKIEVCDRRGLRMCVGALPRTSNVRLAEESTLEPLSTLLERSVLRTGVRLLYTPELRCVWNTITDASSSGKRRLDYHWLECWRGAGICRQNRREDALSRVFEIYPKQKPKKWKYFTGSFWRERMLARFRMGVLPTRAWAYSMRLSASDVCRHCHEDEETMDHLLLYCDEVDRDDLCIVWFRELEFQVDFTLEAISNVLKFDFRRTVLENALIGFIRKNNLFKKW